MTFRDVQKKLKNILAYLPPIQLFPSYLFCKVCSALSLPPSSFKFSKFLVFFSASLISIKTAFFNFLKFLHGLIEESCQTVIINQIIAGQSQDSETRSLLPGSIPSSLWYFQHLLLVNFYPGEV